MAAVKTLTFVSYEASGLKLVPENSFRFCSFPSWASHHRKLSDVASGPNRMYSFESPRHLMA
jgi:hypothetical protein